MSRRLRGGPLEPLAPILTKDVDKRLGAITRRHGGKPRPADSGHHLPNPPRGECDGQLDMFTRDESG